MHHFLCRLYWPLLKVHFAGHVDVKLVLDIGMWVTELGMWVTGYELSTRNGAPVRNGGRENRVSGYAYCACAEPILDLCFFAIFIVEDSLSPVPLKTLTDSIKAK